MGGEIKRQKTILGVCDRVSYHTVAYLVSPSASASRVIFEYVRSRLMSPGLKSPERRITTRPFSRLPSYLSSDTLADTLETHYRYMPGIKWASAAQLVYLTTKLD